MSPTPTRDARQRDIEKLLTDVLGESRSASPAAMASPRTTSRSRPASVVSSRPLSDERRGSAQRISSETGDTRDSRATASVSGTTYVASATQTLGITPTISVYEEPSDAPPKKETVTYDKGIQTSDEWEPQRKERGVGLEEDESLDGRETPRPLSETEKEKIRDELRKEIEDEVRAAVQPGSVQPVEEARFPARTLSNDELDAVTTSKDFQDFLDQSTKVIERALDEEYDLLTDYAHGKTSLDEEDEGYSTRGKRGRRVRQVAQYWDERWSKKRQISDIGFSPKVGARPGIIMIIPS
jgi:dynein intermediate chain